jgi:hypothetical protein
MSLKLLSTGEAAVVLGMTRDALTWAFRTGAPEPRMRISGRRVFDPQDLDRIRSWMQSRQAATRRVSATTPLETRAEG